MILVDLNQISISNLMQEIKTTEDVHDGLVRHMILSTLLHYRRKFSDEFGELVICCDSPRSWRKDVFAFYKANRKKDREGSKLDWNKIFLILNNFRNELKKNFPYRVLEVRGAEADDIIACLVQRFYGFESHLILSSDKDFIQLHKYPKVKKFSPIQKKFISHDDPVDYLKEHIIKGDRGDGVPNILSDDDTFVSDKRQRKLQKFKLDSWKKMKVDEFCNDRMLRNYHRNEQLVSLDKIPNDINKQIVDQYTNYSDNGRTRMFNYFVNNKLKNLIEHIGDF